MNAKEKVSFQLGLETLQRIRHVISQLVEQTRTVMAWVHQWLGPGVLVENGTGPFRPYLPQFYMGEKCEISPRLLKSHLSRPRFETEQLIWTLQQICEASMPGLCFPNVWGFRTTRLGIRAVKIPPKTGRENFSNRNNSTVNFHSVLRRLRNWRFILIIVITIITKNILLKCGRLVHHGPIGIIVIWCSLCLLLARILH